MRFRASDVAAATGGRLVGPDVELDGASFDTRSLRPGQLFVALVAERDGHAFLADAERAGAGAALVSRPADVVDLPTVLVADTATALLALAAWGRQRTAATVVGITGSVGKTSTKDLAVSAIGARRRVSANERSFNNEQGLPVTVLGAPDDTDVLILEMGMRGSGEIARLCGVARPTIGVVTAVAPSHTERVGGIEGVAAAKAELVRALPADGIAVLNADDGRVAAMAEVAPCLVVTYGRTPGADVTVGDVELDELARASFRVDTPWGSASVHLAVSGMHMASNAAAALALAGCVGVDVGAAAEALGRAGLSALRMQTTPVAAGGVVVDDTYNANPTSMRAALDAVAAMRSDRRVAVLGPMAELDDPAAGHREVAAHAAGLGIAVVAVDTDAYGVAPVADPVAAVGPIGHGTVVLVKASRAAGLERVAAALVAASGGADGGRR